MTLSLTADPVPLRLAEEGRVYRVGDTRVSLDTLIGAYSDGCDPDEIAIQYPSLLLADIHAVLAYYLRNQEIVDRYLAERELAAGETIRQIRANSNLVGIRERLKARQAEREPASVE